MTLIEALIATRKIKPETREAVKNIKTKEDWEKATMMVSKDTGFGPLV
jgi:hypothetical protein